MIKEFQKEYRWLSNFMPCVIIYEGVEYRSVEHAYMSAKSNDPEWKQYCQNTEEPGFVKKKSKGITLREDWDTIKCDVMWECLNQKYRQEPYKSKLIETGDMAIQEGNHWKDTFWGVDLKTGKGQNKLGIMIMNIRTAIQKEVLPLPKPISSEDVKRAAEAGNSAFAYYMEHGKLPVEK